MQAYNDLSLRNGVIITNGFISRTATRIGIAFVIVIGLITACEQPDSPVGSGVGPDIGGKVRTVQFTSVSDTSFYAPYVRTSNGNFLYVGASHGITSSALIKYDRPLYRDSITIDSCWMTVWWKKGNDIGDGAVPLLSADILDYAWTEASRLSLDSLPAGQGVNCPQQGTTVTDSTSLFHWAVPAEQVRTWFAFKDSSKIDTNWVSPRADSSFTVRISAPTAVDRLLALRSKEGIADSLWMRPLLRIKVTRMDSVGYFRNDTITLVSNGDLFAHKNDSVNTGDRLVIGRGAPFRSVVHFNWDSLKTVADNLPVVVNKAYITVFRDKNSFPWAKVTPSLSAGFLLDDGWKINPDSVFASFALSAAVDSTTDSVRIDVTNLFASRHRQVNYGIMLRTDFEGYQIDRMAFFRSSAPVVQKPRLTVIYTEFDR